MMNSNTTGEPMPNHKPLVSIICLCYNHERYVKAAIASALNQTYNNIEIIVVDDASTDGSVDTILNVVKDHPQIKFIALKNNIGNCRAFNFGYSKASGEYIIDLAADDMLLPKRVEAGILAFEKHGPKYGVNFSDAVYIDAEGNFLKQHYLRNKNGTLKSRIPEADVYKDILKNYFICPPTFMARREVFEYLGGYDESLAYEDFDFFVRSSRKFKFCYTDKVLVQKRVLPTSLSNQQYVKGSKQLLSTYYICEKAFILNKTREEHLALRSRIRYELIQAIISGNYNVAQKFIELYSQNPAGKSHLFLIMANLLVLFRPNLSLVLSIKSRSRLLLKSAS